jgi:Flp pilus assembly protein TadB
VHASVPPFCGCSLAPVVSVAAVAGGQVSGPVLFGSSSCAAMAHVCVWVWRSGDQRCCRRRTAAAAVVADVAGWCRWQQ